MLTSIHRFLNMAFLMFSGVGLLTTCQYSLAQSVPQTIPLSSLQAAGSIESFRFTPDGQHVIYIGENPGVGNAVLFQVSTRGGTPQILTQLDNPARDVSSFQVTSDGRFIVFNGRVMSDIRELYRIPVGGGEIVRISSSSNPSTVLEFNLSDDGRYAVFQTRTDRLFRNLLFSVEINSGNLVELSQDLGGNFGPDTVKIEPRTNRVVFIAFNSNFTRRKIFSVPIDSTTITTLASEDRTNFAFARDLVLNADGSRVAYAVGGRTRGLGQQLFSSPIDQPNASVEITQFFPDTFFFSFFGNPVESKIYIESTLNSDPSAPAQVFEMPFDGGLAPEAITPTFPNEVSGVDSVGLTANGRSLVYRADPNGLFIFGLFSLDLRSNRLVDLFKATSNASEVNNFKLAADSKGVVYELKRETASGSLYQLFSVPLNGGTPIPLTPEVADSEAFGIDFRISPDAKTVVFSQLDRSQLFATEIPSVDDGFCVPIVAKNQKVAVVCL